MIVIKIHLKAPIVGINVEEKSEKDVKNFGNLLSEFRKSKALS